MLSLFILAALTFINACQTSDNIKDPLLLRNNWAVQSSDEIRESGKTISSSDFKAENWYPATVPSTVFGTLVEYKVYPDPYFGTNIKTIPGYIVKREGEIPADSPFRAAFPTWRKSDLASVR